ncbi:hypothetical protein [Aurantibacter aestuarii]|uniref:Carboxypeptidase-like regulatory domain-containing protein n=1 Tax=Aurantibacter aestuarii TaxID=1266046 RepID=A0A2T1NFV6_9FLAO|nr:hypothetical protein [Aurantibacter aestuarii]PSG91626.1 hypothetical protein C7H52_00500 [Aurantibacter aestuarii]
MKYVFIIFFIIPILGSSQIIEISGKIEGKDDLDGIHVINKTSNYYAVTTVTGDFKIKVKTNDTIVFSSILYKLKEVVVTPIIYKSKYLSTVLETFVNDLDEVTLGKVLTGNLSLDVANQGNKKQINFADVGIPGYTGKPLTQSARRLKEASNFMPTVGGGFGGGGVGLQINPIINAITGRTKELKQRVLLENKTSLLEKIKSQFAATFFESYELPEDKREEFFLYCSDQPNFIAQTRTLDLNTVLFLEKYYALYLQQINK